MGKHSLLAARRMSKGAPWGTLGPHASLTVCSYPYTLQASELRSTTSASLGRAAACHRSGCSLRWRPRRTRPARPPEGLRTRPHTFQPGAPPRPPSSLGRRQATPPQGALQVRSVSAVLYCAHAGAEDTHIYPQEPRALLRRVRPGHFALLRMGDRVLCGADVQRVARIPLPTLLGQLCRRAPRQEQGEECAARRLGGARGRRPAAAARATRLLRQVPRLPAPRRRLHARRPAVAVDAVRPALCRCVCRVRLRLPRLARLRHSAILAGAAARLEYPPLPLSAAPHFGTSTSSGGGRPGGTEWLGPLRRRSRPGPLRAQAPPRLLELPAS